MRNRGSGGEVGVLRRSGLDKGIVEKKGGTQTGLKGDRGRETSLVRSAPEKGERPLGGVGRRSNRLRSKTSKITRLNWG